jgi:hypothetical protein
MDLTDDLIKQVSTKCFEYCKSPYYQDKLQQLILEPVLTYLSKRIYPYFFGVVILLIINILCIGLAIYFFTKNRV